MLNWIKWSGEFFKRHGESGVTLVEALVAVAVLGGGVLTMILTLSGGALAVQENDHEAVAQSLVRTQMEYIKNAPYAGSYAAVSTPAGYGVSVGVDTVPGGDSNIQQITANITLNGSVIMSVTDFKVNR